MKTVKFTACKVSFNIDLQKVAAVFRLPAPESWKDCLVLDEQPLSEVYKHRLKSRRIYLFKYGALVFENFREDETDLFVEFLDSITGGVDYGMLAKYREIHEMTVSDDMKTSLWEGSGAVFPHNSGLSAITAAALSKSAALSKVEADAELLSDESEGFINKLQKGSLNIGSRSYSATIARILRFEYESTVVIGVLDRPSEAEEDLDLRKAYDMLSDYYELDGRYNVLNKKASELRSITGSYSLLQVYSRERRLLLFEIFLLALFPLSYLLHDLLRKYGIEHVLKIFSMEMLQKFNIFF